MAQEEVAEVVEMMSVQAAWKSREAAAEGEEAPILEAEEVKRTSWRMQMPSSFSTVSKTMHRGLYRDGDKDAMRLKLDAQIVEQEVLKKSSACSTGQRRLAGYAPRIRSSSTTTFVVEAEVSRLCNLCKMFEMRLGETIGRAFVDSERGAMILCTSCR